MGCLGVARQEFPVKSGAIPPREWTLGVKQEIGAMVLIGGEGLKSKSGPIRKALITSQTLNKRSALTLGFLRRGVERRQVQML